MKKTIQFKAQDILDNDFIFQPKKLTVISTYPKINTHVCSQQTIKIMSLAKQYPNIDFVNISNDSVDNIRLWCGNNVASNVIMLSDKKYHDFKKVTGLYIKLTNTLSRNLLIVNNEGLLLKFLPSIAITKQVDFDSLELYLEENKDSYG